MSKEEEEEPSNKRLPTKTELLHFITNEDTRRQYMKLDYFYKSAKALENACVNQTSPDDGGYLWHPDVENAPEREIAGKIAWAIGTQDIYNIGQAAEIGMTCKLFNELVKMRDSYNR
jgi:hypothetical protein